MTTTIEFSVDELLDENPLDVLGIFDTLAQTDTSMVALGIESLFRRMESDRERTSNKYPWLYGILLCWLEDTVGENGSQMSRYEYLQTNGYWEDRKFIKWANEATGVEYKTWRSWMRCVKVQLLSEQGQAVIDKAGVSLPEYVERVPIEKAVRANHVIAAGSIRDDQIEILVDPSETANAMKHAIKATPEELESAKVRRELKDEEFVQRGNGDMWIDFEPIDGNLALVDATGEGFPKRCHLARFPVSSNHPLVSIIVDDMVSCAKGRIARTLNIGNEDRDRFVAVVETLKALMASGFTYPDDKDELRSVIDAMVCAAIEKMKELDE